MIFFTSIFLTSILKGHTEIKMIAPIKVLYLALFVIGVKASVIPVEKCKLGDSECLMPAFQKMVPVFIGGMPDQGVEVLDPLQMDDFSFDLSGLQFTMKDGVMKGLKGSIIDKVKWDTKKNRIEVDYHLNGVVKGHYTAAGRLLILPISGDGNMKLKLKNLFVRMFIDYKIEKDADGKDHVAPTKFDFDFNVRDSANFNLTNLFNGNKELSDTMHQFLNENWKQVSAEFGRPMMEVSAKKVYKNIIAFFKSLPIEDIADI